MTTLNAGTIVIPIQTPLVEMARLNAPLLGIVPKWETPDEVIKVDVNLGGAAASGESVTADVTTFSGDQVSLAQHSIATYRLRSSFQISEVKFSQALARGENALENLLDYSSANARRELLQTLGGQIVAGTGNAASGGVVGLEAITGASSALDARGQAQNAYGGIDPAVAGNELWVSLVEDGVGALTKANLNDFEADLRSGATSGVAGNYNMVAMSPTTALVYADVFDAQATVNTVPVGGVDLGYGVKTYNGRPIIEDANLANGEIHFLDSAQLRLYSFNQAEGAGMSVEQPTEGILTYVKQLPSQNPQMLKFALFGMYQLVLLDRSGHAAMRGVTA